MVQNYRRFYWTKLLVVAVKEIFNSVDKCRSYRKMKVVRFFLWDTLYYLRWFTIELSSDKARRRPHDAEDDAVYWLKNVATTLQHSRNEIATVTNDRMWWYSIHAASATATAELQSLTMWRHWFCRPL